MAATSKKTPSRSRSASADGAVVYRGIKIAPIAGKRSKTSEAIREALRSKAGQVSGQPAHG